jgi:hypothetical protein
VSSAAGSVSDSTIAVPSALPTTRAVTRATLAGNESWHSHRNRGRPAMLAGQSGKHEYRIRPHTMGNPLKKHKPCRKLR